MKYDIILFDADGTLLDFHTAERNAMRITLSSVGIEMTETLIAEYSKINDALWKLLELGGIEKSELRVRRFKTFSEKFNIDCPAEVLAATYENALSREGGLLLGAKELCEGLYGKAEMYIVTNGIEEVQRGRLERCGLLGYFDGVFISECVGFEKPRVEFFEYVEKSIVGFDKARTVIVGDSLSSDIKGGINFGIDTVWFNPSEKPAPEELERKITRTVKNFFELYSFITGEENGNR